MELFYINDRKLKILLTKEDMIAYRLTAESMDYNNTETKRAFWSILDDAKQKTGFDAAKDKIYVQLFPSRGGGCELFVTRLTESAKAPTVAFSKAPTVLERALFRFHSLADLLAACACLAECGYAEASCAYSETNAYYLTLALEKRQSEEGGKVPTAIDLVAEFGKRLDNTYEAFLTEHAECLCPHNAVERLAALHAPHG